MALQLANLPVFLLVLLLQKHDPPFEVVTSAGVVVVILAEAAHAAQRGDSVRKAAVIVVTRVILVLEDVTQFHEVLFDRMQFLVEVGVSGLAIHAIAVRLIAFGPGVVGPVEAAPGRRGEGGGRVGQLGDSGFPRGQSTVGAHDRAVGRESAMKVSSVVESNKHLSSFSLDFFFKEAAAFSFLLLLPQQLQHKVLFFFDFLAFDNDDTFSLPEPRLKKTPSESHN